MRDMEFVYDFCIAWVVCTAIVICNKVVLLNERQNNFDE